MSQSQRGTIIYTVYSGIRGWLTLMTMQAESKVWQGVHRTLLHVREHGLAHFHSGREHPIPLGRRHNNNPQPDATSVPHAHR